MIFSYLDKWLFFTLLCVSFLFTVILIIIWVRWCLHKRKGYSKPPEQVELKNTVAFRYEAGVHAQQFPLRQNFPPQSLPTTPSSPRKGTTFAIERRHSLDPRTLDVNMYSREKSESMGSIPYLGLGRLCFNLFYDRQTEKMSVKIKSIAQLNPKHGNITPSVFVKVVILPDKKRRYQTKTIKDCNPEFDEEFVFVVPVDEILNRTMRLTVCSYDRFSRQNSIGYVVFPIVDAKEDLVMEGGTGEIWREITKEDIIVSEIDLSAVQKENRMIFLFTL